MDQAELGRRRARRDPAIAWAWPSFGVRWLHVITAIAGIGGSFCLIALDLGLRRGPHLPQGVTGEAWQIHGGGRHHIRTHGVAPPEPPERLTWFACESDATRLSGRAVGRGRRVSTVAIAQGARLWQAAPKEETTPCAAPPPPSRSPPC